MSTSSFVYDVDEQSFQEQVLQASMEALVLVDFWAPWCQPCQALAPLLEKVAEDYQGALKVAKVNTDEYQALAGHLGVRNLPTVKVIKQGQLVNEFTGAQPEHVIRQIVEAYLGPAEALPATEEIDGDDLEQALAQARAGLDEDPENATLKVRCVVLLARLGRSDEASQLYDSLTTEDRQAEGAEQAHGWLYFAEALSRTDETQDDWQKQAAQALFEGQWEGALELLLAALKQSRQSDQVRQALLCAFAVVEDETLVADARRAMSRLLF